MMAVMNNTLQKKKDEKEKQPSRIKLRGKTPLRRNILQPNPSADQLIFTNNEKVILKFDNFKEKKDQDNNLLNKILKKDQVNLLRRKSK